MQRTITVLFLCLFAGGVHASVQGCPAAAAPLATDPLSAVPAAPELAAPGHRLGAPHGVLAHPADQALSVDDVLLRLRQQQQCLALASAAPATSPALPAAAPGAYKPQTQFDNTPWRFDMSQNGKRMTAEEFDAWMKSRGVRVAKGAPGASAPPAAPAAPVTPPPDGPSDGSGGSKDERR